MPLGSNALPCWKKSPLNPFVANRSLGKSLKTELVFCNNCIMDSSTSTPKQTCCHHPLFSKATQPVAKLHNSEIAVFVFQGWGIFAKSKELSGSNFIPQALPLCKYSSCDQVPADLGLTKTLAFLCTLWAPWPSCKPPAWASTMQDMQQEPTEPQKGRWPHLCAFCSSFSLKQPSHWCCPWYPSHHCCHRTLLTRRELPQ